MRPARSATAGTAIPDRSTTTPAPRELHPARTTELSRRLARIHVTLALNEGVPPPLAADNGPLAAAGALVQAPDTGADGYGARAAPPCRRRSGGLDPGPARGHRRPARFRPHRVLLCRHSHRGPSPRRPHRPSSRRSRPGHRRRSHPGPLPARRPPVGFRPDLRRPGRGGHRDRRPPARPAPPRPDLTTTHPTLLTLPPACRPQPRHGSAGASPTPPCSPPTTTISP